MSHTQANHAAAFDELDPHGQHSHGQHDSHVIIGPKTLLAVLTFLLMFTALTVAFARLEIYIQDAFNIMLPWWVNVIGAMTIASIKSLMVMAYFMQLKYDNPINSVAMLFCFFCLGIFLAFTGLDLFTRGNIYEYKAGPVVAGGTGKGIIGANDQPVTVASMNRLKVQIGEPDVRDYLIIAEAISLAGHDVSDQGEAGAAASKALSARANAMMDLKKLKFFSVPAGGAVSSAVKYLGEDALRLRAGGNAAAADIVDQAAKSIQAMDLQKAAAAYSVDAMFNTLAAVAHGHAGHGHGDAHVGFSGNTSSTSRSKNGLSGALDTGSSHGKAHGTSGGHAEHK